MIQTLSKLLARFCLWLIGVAIPVFIAACYGMPYRFTKNGRVVDAATGVGINGIKVTCLDGARDYNYSYTYGNGGFELDYDRPCDAIRVDDVDGVANGQYESTQVPFCEDCPDLTIELNRVK